MGYAYALIYGAATIAGVSLLSAVVRAYLARVAADGGTSVDDAHAEEVYTDTVTYNPLLIESCESGKATVLYTLFAFQDINTLQARVTADGGTNVDVGHNAKVAQHLWRYNLHNDASIVVTCASTRLRRLYAYQPTVEPDTPTAFVTTWETTTSSETISLPLVSGGTYDFYVNWGDGSNDIITAYNQAEVTHTYATADTYTVTIAGTIEGWRFNNAGDKTKIQTIESYGSLAITTDAAFYGCSNLTSTATDAPTISTTSLARTFQSCTNFNGAIGNWDVSSVTNMYFMFNSATSFNQDIGGWDVSNVTRLEATIYNADGMSSANLGAVKDWTITALTNATNFQNACTNSMSTSDYDALLIAWEGQTPNNNVTIHFNAATYTAGGAAEAARTSLTTAVGSGGYGWTITDGGTA